MAGRIAARNISRVLCPRTRHFFSTSFTPLDSSRSYLPVDPIFKASGMSKFPILMRIGNRRAFSADVSQLPVITDPDILLPFKDLIAASWDELPDTVVYDAKKALSKSTDDKAGQEALANVFRAADAVEHFGGVLVSLRMELDDETGITGEAVGPLSDEHQDAMHAAYKRYMAYLDSFGPDETYLRKKVETELGTKMIHLKMRCGGLDSGWGKITVLGTSGLSGSYVEQRA
ncbi:hypothetical protein AMTRI_Chr06g176950 [Amborella trichopoda]